jgi:PAS domain S-box-containing protein
MIVKISKKLQYILLAVTVILITALLYSELIYRISTFEKNIIENRKLYVANVKYLIIENLKLIKEEVLLKDISLNNLEIENLKLYGIENIKIFLKDNETQKIGKGALKSIYEKREIFYFEKIDNLIKIFVALPLFKDEIIFGVLEFEYSLSQFINLLNLDSKTENRFDFQKSENINNFTVINFNNLKESLVYTYLRVENENSELLGFLTSSFNDRNINFLYYEFITKILISYLFLWFIRNLYNKILVEKNQLEQHISFINKTAIVFKFNRIGYITFANNRFCDLSGYEKNEIVGSNFNQDIFKASSDFQKLFQILKYGKNWNGQISKYSKNGKIYTISIDIFPIYNEYSEIIEFIAIGHDITELELFRERLENSLLEKSELVNQYEDAIVNSNILMRLDKDLDIVYANNIFIKTFGFSFEEIISKNIFQLFPEDRELLKRDFKDSLSSKKIFTILIRLMSKCNKKHYLQTTVKPIKDLQNNINSYLIISTDITEVIELQKEIVETQKEVIFQMGAIGESRSKETGNHVKRVAEYSKALALLYGLPEEEAELLKQASPMHDIGKVGIPDDILKKPGKLTNEEFEVMKTHADLGYEMLKHSNRKILKTASIVAHQHHEKWNGFGYPRGLKGDEIHIYGRITAIADVFDALGSDRVYKKAWELEKILTFFKKESGEHFDPILVELFKNNLHIFLSIKEKFKDI